MKIEHLTLLENAEDSVGKTIAKIDWYSSSYSGFCYFIYTDNTLLIIKSCRDGQEDTGLHILTEQLINEDDNQFSLIHALEQDKVLTETQANLLYEELKKLDEARNTTYDLRQLEILKNKYEKTNNF